MDADARKAQTLFNGSDRYYVPAYQRPYVWEEERQWQPLWDDLERLADANLEDREELHFLGAVVLKQESSSPGGFTAWSVIDGQQRLTTMQLLFSAMAAAAEGDGVDIEAKRLRKLTLHDEDDAEGDERFRFWPTNVNQDAYRHVMRAQGPNEDRSDDPDNNIEEAWLFFRERSRDYVSREETGMEVDALDPEERIARRYEALRRAALGMIEIVAINLDKDDPAQVIFETLNARGTPLLATDLVKNALFEKVADQGHNLEEIYLEYWAPGLGDHKYWSEEERLGRNTVPRSESFLMHWLAMKLGGTVSADSLFDRFRREFLDGPDGADALVILEELREDSNTVCQFEAINPETPAGSLLATTRLLDTTVFYPLTLLLLRLKLNDEQARVAFGAVESYLMRRTISRLSSNNYNQLVGEIITEIYKSDKPADQVVVAKLIGSQADSSRWPTDEEVSQALLTRPMYGVLGRRRIFDLLAAVELTKRASSKTESIQELPKDLQIEHIMPQSWQTNWPIDNPDDQDAHDNRETRINLLGNLTLVSGSLNAGMSNSDWKTKRKALNEHSILLLNKELDGLDEWDEDTIDRRGEELAEIVLALWPGPQEYVPEGWSAPDAEMSPENTDISDELVREMFGSATDYFRDLLVDLANHRDERRTYTEIEDGLVWPRRRLATVLSGFSRRHRDIDNKRPFHIHLDRDGSWWLWMDSRVASIINELLEGEEVDREARRKEIITHIQTEEMRELVDNIESRLSVAEGCSGHVFRGRGRVVLEGPGDQGARGYFAQKWLFLWWHGSFPGDQAWFKARLSKPDQVVDNNGLRLHVADLDDLDVVLEALKK